MIFPTNSILYKITKLKNVAVLNPIHAIVLVVISVCLTMIGGSIPAKMASKKNQVEALRTEYIRYRLRRKVLYEIKG